MFNKKRGIIVAGGVALLCVGVWSARFAFSSGSDRSSVEANFLFELADKNKDGRVSQDEARVFLTTRQTLVESGGRLEIVSETGELRESKAFADEAARAEFQRRTQMKDRAK